MISDWLSTSGAAATTPGSARTSRQRALPVVHAEAVAEGQDPEVGVGHEDAVAQVVAQTVHHAEHHDERHDADRDAADRDHGAERERPRPAAPQVPHGDPALRGARAAGAHGRGLAWEAGARRRHHPSGRMAGKRITSRMEGWSVSTISSRSTPTPSPPVGGMPYSSARMKSASSSWASSSPAARCRAWSSKRRALVVGIVELAEGVGQLPALHEELEALGQRADRSRWGLASGESARG